WIHQIPDTSLQWEIVVAIVRLTRIFQRLLCKIRCCRFNWSTQQLCENMGLRRFFE
ncbi:hypothetical protein GZ803_005151, partial [Escherichia coli]|nr:hypothetical protein [Escherichia coli]